MKLKSCTTNLDGSPVSVTDAEQAEFTSRIKALADARMKAHEAGVPALHRLMKIAQGNSGQCRHVAAFLLGLYNGNRFPFDLTDFRSLDRAIFDDCITVLQMDVSPKQEVHCYFDSGGRLFEQLASDWNMTDYAKLRAEHQA